MCANAAPSSVVLRWRESSTLADSDSLIRFTPAVEAATGGAPPVCRALARQSAGSIRCRIPETRRSSARVVRYGQTMTHGGAAGTQIVIDAWVALAGSVGMCISVIGIGLTIVLHFSKRFDRVSDRLDRNTDGLAEMAIELALVRERVTRLEDRTLPPAAGPVPLA